MKEKAYETLRDKYTFLKPCCVYGEPDAHTVWIRVEHQSFQIDGYQSTKEDGEWMRLMIGKALARMMKLEYREFPLTDPRSDEPDFNASGQQ